MPASTSNNRRLWLAWITASLFLVAVGTYMLMESDDRTVFMPGPLTGGHHQIGIACDACHTESFADGETFQEACISCHGEDRKKPFDSHPRSKFTDPRNADTLENINAQLCITCHTEHQPEMTGSNGLTQPADFCLHCHGDIGEERPSHAGMLFDTCNSAGCHNFHNNRALYTDFLYKHLGEPEVLEEAVLPAREFASILGELMDYPADRYPLQALGKEDADAPDHVTVSAQLERDWLETAHAASGVNCSACHVTPAEDGEAGQWEDKPGHGACASCHELEVDRFKRGKHGMRLALDLSPMKPAMARLPMKQEAAHEELDCNACHTAHRFDTRHAAVEGCLDCHDDRHSLAYRDSPHHVLWQQETAGQAEAGTGVSCASCHMPRINFDVNDWMSRIMVDHNQNATLSPNEKMIRPACLHCHGLAFTLDALADRELVDANFNGRPTVHVESMELAEADHKRAEEERATAPAP